MTFEMLTVASFESTMNRTQVQLWYNRFKEGREDVSNDENIEAVTKINLDNRRITIRDVPHDDVGGISFRSCQAIFMDVLSMKRTPSEDCCKIDKF